VTDGTQTRSKKRSTAISLTSENKSFVDTVSAVWFAELRPNIGEKQRIA
jgi:hypothetical protein